MDTNMSSLEVPDFKLAKVGERKRRRGAGLPWWLGGKGSSNFTGALGGSGSAGGVGGLGGAGGIASMFSTVGAKVAVAILASTLGVGAYTVGRSLAPEANRYERQKGQSLFAQNNSQGGYAGDLSKLPGAKASGQQDSLLMVSGSSDGLTPEERAAKAKAAEDAAKAAAEEQARADAEAAKRDQAAGGTPGMPDPAAMAAAAAAAEKEKNQSFNRKFGEMSSRFGSGSGLAGGGGLGGGVGRSFDVGNLKGTRGNIFGMSNTGKAGSTAGRKSRAGRNPGRGLAQRQLNNAYMYSDRARKAGANETRSANASAPFDNNPVAGDVISGPGAGNGGKPTASKSDGATSTNPGGGGPVGGDDSSYGGGEDTVPDDCGALAAQFGWQGEFVNSSAGGCVLNEAGTSVDPTDIYFDILDLLAKIALILSIILVIAAIMQLMVNPYIVLAGFQLAHICAMLLMGVGAMMALIGIMIVGMGRKAEGTIFAAMGLLTTIAGYMAYAAAGKAATTAAGVQAAGSAVCQPLAIQCGISGLVSTGASGYAGSVDPDPRTFNNDTQQWE